MNSGLKNITIDTERAINYFIELLPQEVDLSDDNNDNNNDKSKLSADEDQIQQHIMNLSDEHTDVNSDLLFVS